MLKKILVCLDGSRFAEGILPYVIERAQHFSSKTVLFKVVNTNVSAYAFSTPGMSGQPVPIIAQRHLDGLIRDEEARDKSYLEGVAARLRLLGLDVEIVTRRRAPGDTISDTIASYAAEHGFDLILMATHGHRFWIRLIFGSMTESVIRKSRVPVLVVSPRYDETKDETLGEMPQASVT
ncbi:MAG: universal stress protein [Chloroflexi bacterium]|nr:universal stress protein [Chloroflexota bacterium]